MDAASIQTPHPQRSLPRHDAHAAAVRASASMSTPTVTFMEKIIMSIALAALAANARGETVNFDNERPGVHPPDWISGVTGSGKPHWSVEADPAG